MAQNGTKKHVLAQDLSELRESPKYADLGLEVLERSDGQEYWKMKIRGTNYYEGNVYDVEIHFSRRHPYEAPMIMFPFTSQNQRNVKHPKVDADGRLRSDIVSLDNWTPIVTMASIIDDTRQIFTENPPHAFVASSSSRLDLLSNELIHKISLYLPVKDICRLSQTSRKHLAILHHDQFWATLYYQRCGVPNNLLYAMPHPGPLRVLSCTGKWHWKDARESFIQAYQCEMYATAVPPLEELVAQELRLMAMVSLTGPVLNNATAAARPRDELLSLWRYRLRRSARVARWLCSDEYLQDVLADLSSTLPASSLQFLASLIISGHMNVDDAIWFQRAASANDRQLRVQVKDAEWELDMLRSQTARLRNRLGIEVPAPAGSDASGALGAPPSS